MNQPKGDCYKCKKPIRYGEGYYSIDINADAAAAGRGNYKNVHSNCFADPFNCPECGSHDFGLHVQLVGDCLQCLKRDAARYRYLRNQPAIFHCAGQFIAIKDVGGIVVQASHDFADQQIDEAILQQTGRKNAY